MFYGRDRLLQLGERVVKLILKIFFALFLICLAHRASAEGLVLTQDDFGSLGLQPYLEASFRNEETWDEPMSIPSDSAFRPILEAQLQQAQEKVIWLRFRLDNLSPQALPVVLMTRNFFHGLQVFELKGMELQLIRDGSFKEEVREPFSKFGTFAETLLVSPGSHTYVIRCIKKLPRKTLVWHVLDQRSAEDLANREIIIKGIFFGFFVAILIYVLVQYIEFREPTFLYYVLYNGAATLNFIFLSGMFRQYVNLPVLAQYQDLIINGTGIGTAVLANVFTIAYLRLKENLPYMRRILLGMSALLLAYVMGLSFNLHAFFYRTGAIVLLLSAPMIVLAGILMVRKGFRPAYFFTLGWSFVILGSIFRAAELLDLMKENFLTQWGFALGSSIEMFVLCFALTEQYRHRERESKKAIEHLNESLSLANQQLEASFLDLKHETQSRMSLVKDLAHRGNNPLHAGQLALLNLKGEKEALTQLVATLLGREEDMEPEALACNRQFQKIFTEMGLSQGVLAESMERMGEAIREIRILSGVDGYTVASISITKLWTLLLQRMEESLGVSEVQRLKVHHSLEGISLMGHSLALIVTLEQLLTYILKKTSGDLSLSWELRAHAKPSEGLSLAWQGAEVKQDPLWQRLVSEHAYLLRPYGLRLTWEDHTEQLVFEFDKSLWQGSTPLR